MVDMFEDVWRWHKAPVAANHNQPSARRSILSFHSRIRQLPHPRVPYVGPLWWVGRQCGVQVKAVFECPTSIGANPPPSSPSNVWGGQGFGAGGGGGASPKGLVDNLLMQFFTLGSSKLAFSKFFF